VFTGLAAGTYNIVVMDSSGCVSAAQKVTINEPNALSFIVLVTCEGENNDSIMITANGGTPPYAYSCDGGQSFQNEPLFQHMAQGIYSVMIQDKNNCTYKREVLAGSCGANLGIYTCCYKQKDCGDILDYMISVRNIGTATAHNIQVTDILPSSLSLVGVQAFGWNILESDQTVIAQLPQLSAGAVASFTINTKANCRSGKILNKVSVISDTTAPKTGISCCSVK